MINPLKQEKHWKRWQIILFRFFFSFLSLLTLIAYNPVIQVFDVGWEKQTLFFGQLRGLVAWLDNHAFHLGYLPQVHSIEFSDTHFGVILTLTILIVAIIATLFWTFFDNARASYNRFYFWFCNYLAYYIFLAMIGYAIEKVIPVQAHYPNAVDLLSPLGSFKKWELLFLFMGASPAYCMFCGWLELIASTLILFNRTRVLGGLLMVIALIQVVSFNVFYNNSIILLSAILLLSTLFIIARALPKLYNLLVKLQPVSLSEYSYRFTTRRKKYAMLLLCLLPVWKVYSTTLKSWKYYCSLSRNHENQRLYVVEKFKYGTDTIPPLTTDSVRWQYIAFLDYKPGVKTMIKYNMQQKAKYYQCNWDAAKKTITILNPNGTINKNSFTYADFANGCLNLKGSWNGKNIEMKLKHIPIDSMNLVKDKFVFMQEDQ